MPPPRRGLPPPPIPRANSRAASPTPRETFRRDYSPCLPLWGKVAPQGRMRGRLPLPPVPGQPVGAASPMPRGGLRRRPSPAYHPRRLPLPPTPAEGSRPLPTDRTIDGCSRQPPGRACPAPTVRRPWNGCPRKPHSVSISPSVGRGASTPPRPSAAANNSPCLPPRGKVAPQGRMRGRLPSPPFPGLPPAETPAAANTRGGVKTPPYGPNH